MTKEPSWNETDDVNAYIIILLKKTKVACLLHTINRL
jgi:hypothetical protein